MVTKRVLHNILLMALLPMGTSTLFAADATAPDNLGNNLFGEVCIASPRDDVSAEPGIPAEQRLLCGALSIGTASYTKAPRLAASLKDETAIKEHLFQQYKTTRVEKSNALRMNCKAPQLLKGNDDTAALALPCQLKSSGLPHLIVVSQTKDIMAVTDAPPASLPNMYKLIGLTLNGDQQQAYKDLLATIWGAPIQLASAAEVDKLKKMLRDARNAENLNRYSESEALFRRALAMQTKMLGDADPAVADTLLDLALNSSNQGRYDEALALFRRAEPIIQRSPFDADRARFNMYQGFDAANRSDYQKAQSFARAASDVWRKIATTDSYQSVLSDLDSAKPNRSAERGELAMALNFEAKMAIRNDDVVSGSALASEAMNLITSTENLPVWWKSNVMLTLGEVSVAQGRLSAAEAYLNSALTIRKQTFGEGTSTIPVLAELGRAYQVEGMATSSIISYREVFKQAKKLPQNSEILNTEQLLPFGAAVADYAKTLTDETAKQGLYAEAFDAFQMARSSVIDKTIAKAQSRLSNQDPAIAALIDQLQTAQRQRDNAKVELSYEQSLPDDDRSAEVENRLQKSIYDNDQIITRLNQQINKQFPAYANLSNPPPLDLLELRKRLGDKEGLVSFIIGRKRSFVQLITRGGNVIAPVAESQSSLTDTVQALRRALEIQGGSINEFDIARANQLYKSLFSAIEPQLKKLDHLIIAPSGPLSSLPFGLLVTELPNNLSDYSHAKWLTQQYAISHTPSMRAFYTLRNVKPVALPPHTFLAFGDPTLVGEVAKKDAPNASSRLANECQAEGPANADTLRALSPLPETATELKTISKIFGTNQSTVFLRNDANEGNLRKQSLDQYRVLYFATHGLLPGELKCQAEPGLVLTPPSSSSKSKDSDGLLEASEISSFKLNADMVVLSACNTAGGGGKFGGEALSGLAEAFFFAGARSMVVSHWQVPSAATAQLMTGMFTKLGPQLQGGASPALQAAQRHLIAEKKTAHPFFWAAFVVVGDGMASTSSAPLPANRSASAQSPILVAKP